MKNDLNHSGADVREVKNLNGCLIISEIQFWILCLWAQANGFLLGYLVFG